MLDKLKSFLPILVIFAIVAVFFYPVWLQGKIPLPGDFVVGVYYPWLDYKWIGYEAGIPVKNPITTDVVSFIFPMQMFAISQLKEGMVPLWNNLILTGTPLMANFQSAPFSPTNIFYFILPVLIAWSLQIIFQPVLAAVFLYLLLREFNINKLASVVGGIFYGFAGFITIWLEWNGHGLVAAFFPLLFYLTIKWLQSSKLIWGFLISLTLAVQFLSGYPQIILYEMLALGLLVLIFQQDLLKNNPKDVFKKILGLIIFIFLGVGLVSFQNLPALELLANSSRSVEVINNSWAFFPRQAVITFLAPDYFGNHTTGNYWGPADYTLTTIYSGVVVVVLGILGGLVYYKNIGARFGIALILASLLVALENPLSVYVKESGFLALQAASAHRALILSNLGFAILAAFGIDAVSQKKYNLQILIKSALLPLIILGGFLVATIILYQTNLAIGDESMLVNLRVGLRNLVLPLSIFVFVLAALSLRLFQNKFSKIIVLLVIAVGILELFRFGWKFVPFSPAELVFPKTPVIEFLQNQQKPFRVNAESVIPINFMMAYGIEIVEGYDAVYPLKYAKYLAVLNSGDVDATPMGRYGSVTNPNSPLLNIINTKYILALRKNKDNKPGSDGVLPVKFKQPFLKPVFDDKSVVVLENTKVLPRAIMFYDWQVEKDERKTLSFLLNNDVSKKIVINTDVGFPPRVGRGTAEFIKDTPNQKEISVKTNQTGLLFISDIFYPGWEAYVDGKLTSIINADYTFMAIPIATSGNHQILIKYDPPSFKQGMIISLVSLGVLLSIIIYAFWQVKRK